MKKIFTLLLLLSGAMAARADGWYSGQNGWDDSNPANTNYAASHPDWVLVFQDNFTSHQVNTESWSRIDYVNRGVSDWRKYQSTDAELVEMTGNSAKLWGRYGDYTSQSDQTGANKTYACGGLWTKDTFSFQYGYVEVRAKFDTTQSCWPAIWLLPTGNASWPTDGEIDIMEQVSGKVYQTLHTLNENKKNNDESSSWQPSMNSNFINDYHTYGMLWEEGSITFTVDGKISYKKSFSESDVLNWPFDKEGNTFYLIVDQQIGGDWAGNPTDETTKFLEETGSAMEVDYVRVYSTENYMHSSVLPEPTAASLALLGLLGLASRRRRI